ncbi:hypothetical protein AB1Y20_008959 [Prymnesium parvum]|uniref:Uncharacterized protein n=1 Tax=Prymnesium parvum TaxID=97485 RepID=A0AB34K2G9_PRYPA
MRWKERKEVMVEALSSPGLASVAVLRISRGSCANLSRLLCESLEACANLSWLLCEALLATPLHMGGNEVNYVHDAEIWRQQMKNEVEVAATWHDNWGFLTGREPPPPRGFSHNVAKYAYGQGKWSVKSVRVADESEEGVAAAVSEQNARKMMSSLSCDTKPVAPVKPCEAKGIKMVLNDVDGVESREAALLMRSHKLQSLGDACLTDGLNPGEKYRAPVLDSHEYGWRVPTSKNGMPNLELFGVAEHGKKGVVKKFN